MFTELYENRSDNFGNGRDVRNCFEDMIVNQSNRVAKMENPTKEDLMTVLPQDLEEGEEEETEEQKEEPKPEEPKEEAKPAEPKEEKPKKKAKEKKDE